MGVAEIKKRKVSRNCGSEIRIARRAKKFYRPLGGLVCVCLFFCLCLVFVVSWVVGFVYNSDII